MSDEYRFIKPARKQGRKLYHDRLLHEAILKSENGTKILILNPNGKNKIIEITDHD